MALANTQDGSGNYIFGGYSTQAQPFTLSSTGATYNGDQGQRQVQIAAGQTVVVGDNGGSGVQPGEERQWHIRRGPTAGNTGTGVVGATKVSNPAAYTGGTYSIDFTTPTTYQVLDATHNVVTSGTYTTGQTVSFSGLQVTLTGAPAAGDSFSVTPSVDQSVFTTVQNLVTALQQSTTAPSGQTQLNNAVNSAINNIDQALDQTQNVQSSVGARLNSITTQQSVAASQQVQLKQSISTLQSLDYPTAITSLDSQQTTLSAAMQAFTLTQGLSLFKFLQ